MKPRSWCPAAKIAPPAVFHDLRRSYGSLLLNAGADAEVIQELLGHADLRMTRRSYAHLLNATVARTVKKKLQSFGLERSNVRKLRQYVEMGRRLLRSSSVRPRRDRSLNVKNGLGVTLTFAKLALSPERQRVRRCVPWSRGRLRCIRVGR